MCDILQWNCKGLRSRAEILKVLMHEHNPGIVCLQETKLGNNLFNPGLNYNFYHSAPPPGHHPKGGAAIIIHKSLQHSQIHLRTHLQAVAVRFVKNKQVTICSVYLPPDLQYTVDDLQNLINELPPPFILLGDFNAHNPLWGGESANRNGSGEVVEAVIDSNYISLLNDGSPTYCNVHSRYTSSIDLSLCSSDIFLDFIWSVNGDLNGSDHFPIHLKWAVNTPSKTTPKWKEDEADWNKYSKGIKIDREFSSFNSHIDAYKYLTKAMLDSAYASIPQTKGNPRRPAVPWWDKTCGVLRKITRKCYRKYKNSGSSTTKTIYQRALAKQRRYYKKKKRESWIYYINGINSKTPIGKVWNKVRKLSGKYVPSPLPTLKVNGTLVTEPKEVAEKLCSHFSNISSPENYSSDFQNIRESQVSLNFESDNSEVYNARFSLRELRDALSSANPTAPGEDNILYSMLKHLPEHAKVFLLKIINKIWETSIMPKLWKISMIIPIRKPGKDSSAATSYRPIALTSCVCKIMEKMVNNRLVWFLEENNLLSPLQYGFRRNRSTLDPLLRLSNQIQQGFAKQQQTVGVFFDLEKAYDTTWRHGIIKQFHSMGIRGNMIKFLKSFLSERFIKVRVGSEVSRANKQEEGVPQGSVLSVTCFSVAINKIVEAISSPTQCSLFVDDFAIYCTSYDAVSACKYIQQAIDSVTKWADENGFKFSVSKTVAVRFTRSRREEVIPTLTLKGNILPFEDTVKFLGMTLDKKLTWSLHIDKLKVEVKRSLNILRVVSGFNWGADRKSLLNLYNSLCRSKLDYGCEIYSSACKTKLKELDVVHNQGLRICSGAFRTSPVESLYVDTNQLPLDLRREELGLRYLMRLKSSPQNPTFKVLRECNDRGFGSRSSKPLQIRINQEVGDASIKGQKTLKIGHIEVPPWLVPEPTICPKLMNKNSQSEEEIRAKFYEHDKVHKNSVKIFTDGSKSLQGVGCSAVESDYAFLGKLPDHASIFTAELTAINQALKLAASSKHKYFTIYSDSFSSLSALQKRNSSHPLIQKAQEWLFWLATRHKYISFCWVPSHMGIQGNEDADKEAKNAAELPEINIIKIPHSDMKGPIKSYILKKWQERWSSPLLANNKKLIYIP